MPPTPCYAHVHLHVSGAGIYYTLYTLFCLLMMLSIHQRGAAPAGAGWEDAPADVIDIAEAETTPVGNKKKQ